MANFFDIGVRDPFSTTTAPYHGNLTKKGGLGNYLNLLSGQTQGMVGEQQRRVNMGRNDINTRYGAIAGGEFAPVPEEERGILDRLGESYKGLLDTSGYEKGVLTPLRGSFNVARDAANRRVARTGNSAGFGSTLAELAREEGRQSSLAGFQVEDEKQRRKENVAGLDTNLAGMRFGRADAAHSKQLQAIQGLAQMYGIDMNMLDALLGRQLDIGSVGRGVESTRRGVLGTVAGIASIPGTLFGG